MSPAPMPRRTVLTAVVVAPAALATGCGDDEGGSTPAASTTPTGTSSAPAPPPSGSPTAGAGEQLARTRDIPVGGGTVFAAKKIVVTQPKAGEFKAFSAVCTHQGCVLGAVEEGTIDCPCHGSRFRIADGSVEKGPATEALPARRITVSGDSILLG
ncbi:Rieske (2Fe-2S) protein [Streptomyces sp. SP18CS02]|uniref:Rieske (2Fe-2S) protein n=1 Tax=Streptomyces sp. SP18CS02 TaxID=3002531 RepID=UPI002E77842E|nr:Rieske (2Fe-2S) protein [Streptomyces sp. SP18CS02]MEE1752415.1 Rieske (2Fe-2S) protein [Streptomyces sp. SP18CS02]